MYACVIQHPYNIVISRPRVYTSGYDTDGYIYIYIGTILYGFSRVTTYHPSGIAHTIMGRQCTKRFKNLINTLTSNATQA